MSNLPAQATMAGSQALAGYLFDEVSLAAPFELSALFQCANAALYALLFTWRPPRPAGDGPAGQEAPDEAASPPPLAEPL